MAEYPFAEVVEIIAVFREKREPIMNNWRKPSCLHHQSTKSNSCENAWHSAI